MLEKEQGLKTSAFLLEVKTGADTQQQGCQHPPTASTVWVPRSHSFYHWKRHFNNAVSRDYCVGCGNFSAMEGSSLSISSKRELAQPELDHNSWCNTWLFRTDVGCGSSAANGLGCLQVRFLFCTGRKLKYLIPFLKVFWHMINSLHLRGRKLFPDIGQSRVPEGFVPGRH